MIRIVAFLLAGGDAFFGGVAILFVAAISGAWRDGTRFRQFASVIFSAGATLDTVHLSEMGHRLMAEMIWRQVGPLLKN